MLAVGVLAVGVLAVLVRLPFLQVPFTADEGGYSYIAWFAARGDGLYSELWIDRPQLLVWTFQLVQGWVGAGTQDLRLAGAVYNAASAVAVVGLASRFLTLRWALLAGALFAWFSASPQIEGFTVNGEFLTTLPSTIAVLLLAVWLGLPADRVWRGVGVVTLVGAGLACGIAFLCKQSGIDAGLALALVLAVAAVRGELSVRRCLLAIAWFGVGVVVVVGAALVHGWGVAGNDYVSAVYGYRLRHDTFSSEPLAVRWQLFRDSLPQVLLALGPLLLLAPFGARALSRTGSEARLLPAWLLALTFAVVLGGQFHPHYYVALVPALAILAAAGCAGLFARPIGAGLVVAAVAAVGWAGISAFDTLRLARADDPVSVSWAVFHESRYLTDPAVGQWLGAHTRPDETILGLYAAADLYHEAHRRSAYPYLWFRGLATIPGAGDRLLAVLVDPSKHPSYVAVVQPPGEIDPSGRLAGLLRRHYQPAASVHGVAILRADERTFG